MDSIHKPMEDNSDTKPINNDYHNEKGLFKNGNVGGPGRPKGSLSLTSKIKKILEDNPEQLASIIKDIFDKHPDLVWKMVDGLPKMNTEITGELNITWKK